jgi:type II secretory pathway component PulF
VAQTYQAAAILMEQGASPATAFQESQLLSKRELKAFGVSLASGDPAWGLRELASWKTERMLNRYSVIVQILVVLITLLMAVIVGLVAVGIMGALATLIDSLS